MSDIEQWVAESFRGGQNLSVPAGRLVVFSSGQYSDYGYNGHFLVLKGLERADFEAAIRGGLVELVEGVKTEYGKVIDITDRYDRNYYLRDRLVPLLIARGLLLEIDVTEIHVDDYGSLSL